MKQTNDSTPHISKIASCAPFTCADDLWMKNCKQSTEHALSVLCVIAFQVVRLYRRMYGELLSSAVHVTMEIVWLLYHTTSRVNLIQLRVFQIRTYMIRSTSSYWKWKVLVELRRRGVERVPLQNLSPLPFPLSLFRSFSVSPLPKFNMAPKQTFHRDYEDRQLRRLLQSSLELIGLLYHSQALDGFFLAASKDGVVACTREILEFLHSFLS